MPLGTELINWIVMVKHYENVKCYALGAIVIIKTDSFQILFSRLRPTVKLAQFKELPSISGAAVAALMCTLIP